LEEGPSLDVSVVDENLDEVLGDLLEVLRAYLTSIMSDQQVKDPKIIAMVNKQFDLVDNLLNENSTIHEAEDLRKYVTKLKVEYEQFLRESY